MVAQLKGFMMTFGNTVGMRAWREIAKPLAKGRIPLDEAMRYFTSSYAYYCWIYRDKRIKRSYFVTEMRRVLGKNKKDGV